jgi:hypothetical protein
MAQINRQSLTHTHVEISNMSNRIEELAKQADSYAVQMNPEEDSYGRPANPRKYKLDRDTKFAELIVRECANIVDENDCEYHIADELLHRFGVAK